jgi:hypothetical protein
MAARLDELDLHGGGLILPVNADSVVPDIELIELLEQPTALAYVLSDDPTKTEWEHQFSCGDTKMYAGAIDGQGVVIITGSFDVSALTGITDNCENAEE